MAYPNKWSNLLGIMYLRAQGYVGRQNFFSGKLPAKVTPKVADRSFEGRSRGTIGHMGSEIHG